MNNDNDLISREALKRKFRNVNEGMFQLSRVYELIDNAPTVTRAQSIDEPKTSRQKRALEIIDALKDDRLIGNKQRGTLRRAILDNTPEVPNNMTLIPTAVLDDLTKTTRELGEWVEEFDDWPVVMCSVCRSEYCLGEMSLDDVRREFKYCPNCGALMTASGKNETE